MELRQLQYFLAVAHEAGFTRAAQRMHVTQPGLSAQIASLERELGQTLFQRGRHGARLTEVGSAVLDHARDALAAVDSIRDTADEYSGLLRGDVRAGFVAGAANDELDIARVLAEFRHDHPHVHVRLSESDTDTMVNALLRGELDVAVIGMTGARLPTGMSTEVILDVPIVAATAAGSSRLPAGVVSLARLAEEPLICLSPGTGLRGVFQRACDAKALTPDIAYEAAAPPVLLRLAAQDLGVAIVPELTSEEEAACGVQTHTITYPALRGQLALAWSAPGNQAPATKVLLDRMRAAFGSADCVPR